MTHPTFFQRLPEVEKFLSASPVKAVVAGRDVDAIGGRRFTTLDPGTGLPLAQVVSMQAEDVDLAVSAATNANGTYFGAHA